MLNLPRGNPISGNAQLDVCIVLDHFAHGHLASVLAVTRGRFLEPLVRCAGEFIARPRLVHQLLDQAQILETERQGKRRVVVAGEDGGNVMLQDEVVGCTAFHGSPPGVRIKTGEFGGNNGFADRRSVDFPQLVVDELGDIAVAENVPVALAATVNAMALPVIYGHSGRCCLQITLRESAPERLVSQTGLPAVERNAGILAARTERLPPDPESFWAWCLSQDQETLLSLLAFVAAQAVNAVQQKADRAGSGRLAGADALAQALAFDMGDWFTPDAESYFGRISSVQIIETLSEAKGVSPAPSWSRMKKAELAVFAARNHCSPLEAAA